MNDLSHVLLVLRWFGASAMRKGPKQGTGDAAPTIPGPSNVVPFWLCYGLWARICTALEGRGTHYSFPVSAERESAPNKAKIDFNRP